MSKADKDAAIAVLNTYRNTQNHGAHLTNKAASQDVYATLAHIEQEVSYTYFSACHCVDYFLLVQNPQDSYWR